ncbi:hypothetical protein EKO27_g8246 [Xylaria grammica]|uniref:Uncharacterized protein n=1 Tax=Xylaria grammica TaxID=363999 RepID=A0A439CXA7_9PEZI|nr:hypothetical protein EKO27_g8246 [Xylaria grammica]
MAESVAGTAPANRPYTKSVTIGLDFGTTYSGVVWSHSDNPDELNEITKWPGNPADKDPKVASKVPTQIRYLSDGGFEWGFQIPRETDHSEVHRLFKLALQPNAFRRSTNAIGHVRLPDNVDRIITDFMSGIFNYALRIIFERLGNTLRGIPIHVVITVPMIWSDSSKERTIQAFRRIPNLPELVTASLLSEPEAAAISAFSDFEKVSLKSGDTFVIVDAGGGTVDLVTYTFDTLLPLLRVREATGGTGDFAGSSLVNQRFKQFLTTKLQNEGGWNTTVLQGALDTFENNTKRSFSIASLAENVTYRIPVPGLSYNVDAGITMNSVFSLKAHELYMCFEICVLRIIRLVKEQITMCNKPVRAVVLVGGFGTSAYLQERIQAAIIDEAPVQSPIELMQPKNAWLAVARGAAMSRITQSKLPVYDIPVVVPRSARKHYGYEIGVRYNDIIHGSMASKKYWNALEGFWHITAMVWFIRKGDDVAEDFPFKKAYYYHWPVGTARGSRTYPLIVYADETSRTAPIERSGSVKLLCRLTADLSSIPDEKLDKRMGADGRMYYYIPFEVEAIYRSAWTQYTVIYKGKRYDTVSAEYV